MFYKVVQADSIPKLTKIVEDLLNAVWILAGGIAFDGNLYPPPSTIAR